MSWVRRLFGGGRSSVITLRDAEAARRFPVQVPLHVRGATREGGARCECGGTREEVLITTGGAAGDAALWRAYPVALDGFRCPKCEALTGPRSLTGDEVKELSRAAVEHATAGREDEAELAFRRVCNSWPGYAPGRFNLARLHRQRADAEEIGEDRALVRRRWLDAAESQLRDALRGEGMPAVAIAGELVEVLLRREAEGEALAVIAEVVGRAELDAEEREALAQLEEFVAKRGDLYDRGVAAVSPFMILHERPGQSLDARARKVVELGVDMLARHVRANPDSWQAAWIGGKGHQALGDREAAAQAFARAFAGQPHNPDVGRELCMALIELGRFEEAMAAGLAACAARPEDAGLIANLALVQLLAGQVDAAAATVQRALVADPEDAITRALAARVADVQAGRRAQPRSVAELEGG
jgi:tetratricopeptide (TPR) repeat protein